MTQPKHYLLKARKYGFARVGFTQNGAALLLLVFLIALVLVTVLVHSTTGVEYKSERDLKTAKVLDDAKVALLGWSVLQNNPGQLPCPEDTNLIGFPTEGQAKSTCMLPAIGRLPWRTLGLGDIRDANNDKLWYAVSSGFRNPPINTNTLPQLSVNGVPNSAVAIIFSVGVPLGSQSRPAPTSSTPPDVEQYLDLSNNAGTASFITSGNINDFNDRLKIITKTELFSLVTKRILAEVRGDSSQGLSKFNTDYGNYPFADINNDGFADTGNNSGTPSYQGIPNSLYFSTAKKNTFLNNGWFPLINYNYTVPSGTPQVALTLNTQTILVTP
ncbi:MAG: hypothetical protein HOO90_05305 [Methylotenera sp.]|uniref:hypothetical protein n=1 Tax=Methylotenera sp. TaxID=2051956 RepID=UPI0017FA9DE9|nr:hypothetical protein [Methylotenera sp.]NOU24933.1 hypothetical protein [Methylotenera sp.]